VPFSECHIFHSNFIQTNRLLYFSKAPPLDKHWRTNDQTSGSQKLAIRKWFDISSCTNILADWWFWGCISL